MAAAKAYHPTPGPKIGIALSLAHAAQALALEKGKTGSQTAIGKVVDFTKLAAGLQLIIKRIS